MWAVPLAVLTWMCESGRRYLRDPSSDVHLILQCCVPFRRWRFWRGGSESGWSTFEARTSQFSLPVGGGEVGDGRSTRRRTRGSGGPPLEGPGRPRAHSVLPSAPLVSRDVTSPRSRWRPTKTVLRQNRGQNDGTLRQRVCVASETEERRK